MAGFVVLFLLFSNVFGALPSQDVGRWAEAPSFDDADQGALLGQSVEHCAVLKDESTCSEEEGASESVSITFNDNDAWLAKTAIYDGVASWWENASWTRRFLVVSAGVIVVGTLGVALGFAVHYADGVFTELFYGSQHFAQTANSVL